MEEVVKLLHIIILRPTINSHQLNQEWKPINLAHDDGVKYQEKYSQIRSNIVRPVELETKKYPVHKTKKVSNCGGKCQ